MIDHSRELDEKAWWDLWNNSYRVKDDYDAVSSELFARVSALINEISRNSRSRLLEVACGTGTLSRMLTFSSYHGLDISPAAIAVAQQKAEGFQTPKGSLAPNYEAADFHDWAIPTQPFDIVVCVDAVSCFRDQKLVLRKMCQCLTPGGRLILTTINPFVYCRIKLVWENGPVSHWFTRKELHSLILSSGLDMERSYTIMPRGNLGILRLINAGPVNRAFGPRSSAFVTSLKERLGLGQYRLVVARKGPGI
jgi:2-polyprenyl-3-methyl-5-hydroxy-6-metoxy-1,4-benzoquinol methylase